MNTCDQLNEPSVIGEDRLIDDEDSIEESSSVLRTRFIQALVLDSNIDNSTTQETTSFQDETQGLYDPSSGIEEVRKTM